MRARNVYLRNSIATTIHRFSFSALVQKLPFLGLYSPLLVLPKPSSKKIAKISSLVLILPLFFSLTYPLYQSPYFSRPILPLAVSQTNLMVGTSWNAIGMWRQNGENSIWIPNDLCIYLSPLICESSPEKTIRTHFSMGKMSIGIAEPL